MNQYKTNSPKETKDLAKNLIANLKGGEILGLVGELGTGKTVFVQGLAEALGIKEVVNSPTFILMKIYTIPDIRYPKSDKRYPPASLREALRAGAIRDLIHIDAYRLESFDQLKEIGVEEYLNKEDCLVVVEWADRVSALRQYPHYHELNFQEGKNYNSRLLTFS